MGRHAVAARRHARWRPSRALVIALVVLMLAAAGLGWWWSALRSGTDPVGADPVGATATVVFSPRCDVGSSTIVDVAVSPPVRTSLSGCGFAQDQVLAVDYLAGHPDRVRLAGTGTTGPTGAGRWLPWAVLALGVLAVGAVLVLLLDRRHDRRVRAANRVSVADLQRALAARGGRAGTGSAGPDEPAGRGAVPDLSEVTARIPSASLPAPAGDDRTAGPHAA